MAFLAIPYVGVAMQMTWGSARTGPPETAAAPVLMARALSAGGRTPADVSPAWLRGRYALEPGAFPRWRRAEFGHVALRSDAAADEARWTCYAVEWAWEAVAARFGRVTAGRLEVTVFRRWGSFQAYAAIVGSDQAESYYDPNRREIVLCVEGRTPAQRFAAIVHEVTHAVQHAAMGKIEATWAAEGLAEYVAASVLASCGMTVEPDADALVRERWKECAPLAKLFAAGPAVFKARGCELWYAQAYSVVRYLIEERGMTAREVASWEPRGVAGVEAGWRAWVTELCK